jgi:hypothetical protein
MMATDKTFRVNAGKYPCGAKSVPIIVWDSYRHALGSSLTSETTEYLEWQSDSPTSNWINPIDLHQGPSVPIVQARFIEIEEIESSAMVLFRTLSTLSQIRNSLPGANSKMMSNR